MGNSSERLGLPSGTSSSQHKKAPPLCSGKQVGIPVDQRWLNWEILTEFQCKMSHTRDRGKDRLQGMNIETLLRHIRMVLAKPKLN